MVTAYALGMVGGQWSSLAAGLSLVPHPALPVEQLEFAFSSLSLADPRWNWPTGSASVEMQTLAEMSCCYANGDQAEISFLVN